ncbi:MAG: VanW family protein [Clostridiales bacterium]|nr:VanW family protein [Clostridiales bacterium]
MKRRAAKKGWRSALYALVNGKKKTKSSANRGRRTTKNTAARRPVSQKKRNIKRRNAALTKITAVVTAVLLACLLITVLYTQVFKAEVDHFFAKKYSVTDVLGAQHKYTKEELAEEVTSDRFYEGIRVNGVDLSGKTLEEAKALFSDVRGKQVHELVDIQFDVDGEKVKMNTEGLSLSSNIDEILLEAYQYGKASTLEGVDGLIERYNLITELKRTPKEYSSSFTLGSDNVNTLTHEALDGFNYSPSEAKATGFDVSELSFIIEESKPGQSVDIDKAISDVKSAFETENYVAVIPVSVSEIEPLTTADGLRSKLGRVSSNSSKTTDKPNRNTNIYLVCKTIDGLILQPGEQFDFNGVVGQRTPEKGYKEATGILNGASNLEYGGGICQANTMLYHSVMEAGLQVDERVAHSWPSDYVDTGTDATVSWEYPDFKFTNNTDYPVAIHAYYGDLWVTVEIYGRLLPDGQYIRFFGSKELLIDEAPTRTEYVADSTLSVGTVVKERSAHNHILAEAYKVTYDADGNELDREVIQTEYRMINAKYRVGTLASDGTIFYMGPDTGEVSAPAGYVPPTQATEPPPETTAAPEETETPDNSEAPAE